MNQGGRERKGMLAKRKRSEIARENGGWLWGAGGQASWCIRKEEKRCCGQVGGDRKKLMRRGRKAEKVLCERCQARIFLRPLA